MTTKRRSAVLALAKTSEVMAGRLIAAEQIIAAMGDRIAALDGGADSAALRAAASRALERVRREIGR